MQLHRAREQFEAAGARLVLIGQATPEDAARFRAAQGIELPVLADRRRESYRALGARVGGVTDLLGPKVVAKGVVEGLRNRVLQGRTVGHSAQLGGALVVAPGGEEMLRHLARDASDNVAPERLLEAIRAIG